ncbi:MAG TPA: hypothetical protein PLB97_02470, partial [Accumulibacter sp.]|nr:hypothetical protein [Accumulibacter sp.]
RLRARKPGRRNACNRWTALRKIHPDQGIKPFSTKELWIHYPAMGKDLTDSSIRRIVSDEIMQPDSALGGTPM